MLEPLQTRIAPAAVFSFTDVDGDEVTIRTGTGTDADLAATGVVVLALSGSGLQLETLNLGLNAAAFSKTDVSITAQRGADGGDGFVNVGFINANGLDLGAVNVKGDLGRIEVGNLDTSAPTVRSLVVQSLGRFGTSTQEMGGDLVSTIIGALGSLRVKGDVFEARLEVVGGVDGDVGPITIGGSLIGGAGVRSGTIESTGDMGVVKIGGDLLAGTGDESAKLLSRGRLASLAIGGSVIGNDGGYTTVMGEDGQIHVSGSLGKVTIGGDMRGGDGSSSARISAHAIGDLTIGGEMFGGSGYASASIQSSTLLGHVKVGGDVTGVAAFSGRIEANGSAADTQFIKSLTIGGNLTGGEIGSGFIFCDKQVGPIKILGDFIGGTEDGAGRISVNGKVTSLFIGGNVIGGSGESSGEIRGFDYETITIRGDVLGGAGDGSGSISSSQPVAAITIGGSLVGGEGNDTGTISVFGELRALKIGVNLQGGSAPGADNVFDTGSVTVERLGTALIGGSIVAGVDAPGGGTLSNSGSIRVKNDIGSLVVKDSIVGNPTHRVLITARGQETPSATADVAIGKLTVGGRVEFAGILAGYSEFSPVTPVNGDAQVGTVKIGGDWIASSLVAGTDDGADNVAGTADDTFLGGGDAGIVSRIASVTIAGQALGTLGPGDSFRVLAEKVGKLTIGGLAYPVAAGPDNLLLGSTGDLRVIDNG